MEGSHIAPPTLRLYPIETHIAEKLHAYTMPRTRPNSRAKDLPDLALLATAQPIDAKRLRAALEQTFAFRKTHALPAHVPEPLIAWSATYVARAFTRWSTTFSASSSPASTGCWALACWNDCSD